MITLTPHISEKAYRLSEADNTYIFKVPKAANRNQIKDAVEEMYDVSVDKIRTIVVKGKTKSTPIKGRYPISGRRSDYKKAYVTLATGDSLPLFEDAA